ncbi:type VI secretion system tube protein Hcp [Pandoraea pnomenusa]|uniref:Hcp family type VI secretion system effector n=1 Tax=Pandoraea pnomenusa TaxID=93220 RepID=UPI001198926F|nr:type VI secretion system tube protein TssD [Pandoraea pnomenusa]QDX23195.1 type VI secretion system tube protein Hcp [Pandoraea pnomenusa]
MGIPAHLWIKGDGGSAINGSSTVSGREGSIEVMGFSHGLNLPIDAQTGAITGTRTHSPMTIEKEIDAASVYLYKAVAKGETLQSAELRWYRIDDSGNEAVYFTMLLAGVKVTGVYSGMANTKLTGASQLNHMETVSLMYERIKWHYADGNLEFSDAWNDR